MANKSDSEHAMIVGADGLAYRLRVHQATGMVAAQSNCDVAEALARIVDHAAAQNITVDDVADRVIERQLRFD